MTEIATDSEVVDADLLMHNLFRAKGIIARKGNLGKLGRKKAIAAALLRHDRLIEAGVCTRKFTQAKLEQEFGITSQALGEMLVKMESDGLITRTPSVHDSRSIVLSLTDSGRVMAEEALVELRRVADDAVSCLEPEERVELARLLAKLNSSL